VAEVDFGPRPVDERAAAAAPAAMHRALVLEPVKNLPHRRPAHPELHGKLALRGQSAVLAELAAGDQFLDPLRYRVAHVPGALDPGAGPSLAAPRPSLGMADAHSETIDAARPGPAGCSSPTSVPAMVSIGEGRACPADQRRRRRR